MGFAASQARLLLLTARKSDLEFRAQQITNSEMILAMQTEEVAREYSSKLSNQTIRYIGSGDKEVELRASNFNATTGLFLQVRGSKNPDGTYNYYDWENNGTPIKKYESKDGKTTYNEADYNDKLQKGEINSADFIEKIVYEGTTNDMTGPQILEGLNNGELQVVKRDSSGQDVVDVINGTSFSVGYNTADDQQADAEYRRKTAALQVKEKRLQMDLQQVEAQQKACDTEIESVKKIMDKNIEKTFKVFS